MLQTHIEGDILPDFPGKFVSDSPVNETELIARMRLLSATATSGNRCSINAQFFRCASHRWKVTPIFRSKQSGHGRLGGCLFARLPTTSRPGQRLVLGRCHIHQIAYVIVAWIAVYMVHVPRVGKRAWASESPHDQAVHAKRTTNALDIDVDPSISPASDITPIHKAARSPHPTKRTALPC